jgi:molybdenum cofactor cytidylyltransferase
MNERDARAVILAAGTSSRIGRQKLLMEFRGRPLIEHAIAAALAWHPVVVCSREVAEYLGQRSNLELVLNEQPERGMSHSLALANRQLRDENPMLVVLADKPLVSESLIETICSESAGADFVYPERNGEPGHPVWLSPRARRFIDYLPPGDTLRLLRENPHLTARAIATEDEGAFFDVDTMDAFLLPP